MLSLAGQLADGLGHAHARGILHRDLKPANVLLTDEGRPMLLDFNLAEDTKLRGAVEWAAVGGTLPYMAPEQLRAFRDKRGVLDGRCDLYALGVILFELLTGRHPFPVRRGLGQPMVSELLADRETAPPSAAGTTAPSPRPSRRILRKCLAPDPARRYQSAEDLREDIDRHLGNRPLLHAPNPSVRERAAKWARRHPRLASSGTVGSVAALLLVALGVGTAYAWDRNRDLSARTEFADHRATFADAQLLLDDRNQSLPRLEEARARLHAILARYGVPDDGADGWLAGEKVRRLPEADRARLCGDIGEAFFLLTHVAYLRALGSDDPAARAENLGHAARWNEAAGRYAGDRLPHAVREQRAALADLRGRRDETEGHRADARNISLDSARDLYLLGAVLTQQGRHREALPHLRKSTFLEPTNLSAWFVRGTAHLALDQDNDAVACFTACLALRDDFAPAWRNRGLALTRLRAFKEGRDDFTRAIALDPRPAEVYAQRAVIYETEGNLEAAEADLTRRWTRAVRQSECGSPGRPFASARTTRPGHERTARRGCASRRPTHRVGSRGAWNGSRPTRAGHSPTPRRRSKIDPFSVSALQLKAHILGERLNKPDDALVVLNRAVELHPDHVPLRGGRGRTRPAWEAGRRTLRRARGPAPRHATGEPLSGRVHLRAHIQIARRGQEGSIPPALVGPQDRVRARHDRHRHGPRPAAERPRVRENGRRRSCAPRRGEARLKALERQQQSSAPFHTRTPVEKFPMRRDAESHLCHPDRRRSHQTDRPGAARSR